jgi:hypothetical protein
VTAAGFCLDYVCDVLFILDMILRSLFVGFYNEAGDLVIERSKVCERYFSSREAWLNVFAVGKHLFSFIICKYIISVIESVYRDMVDQLRFYIAPFDLLLFCGPVSTMGPAQTLSMWRLNRLIRCKDLRSSAVESLIMQQQEYSTAGAPSSSATGSGNSSVLLSQVMRNAIKLCKLTATIFVVAHIFGSLFFIIANQAHLFGNADNWADVQGILPLCSLGAFSEDRSGDGVDSSSGGSGECRSPPSLSQMASMSIRSVYWAMAVLTSVGYGDVTPVSSTEMLFNIAYWLIGTLIFALVIAHLQEIVSQLDVTSDIFKRREDQLNSFLVREGLSRVFVSKAQR